MILQIVWPNTFTSEARISFVLQCNCTVRNMEEITVQSVHFRMDNLFSDWTSHSHVSEEDIEASQLAQL